MAAERAGVRFRTGEVVRGVVHQGGRVRGVALEGGLLEARTVVVAAGSWTSLIDGVPLAREVVYPVRGQLVATVTRPPVFRRVVFGAGGYVLTRPDGRALCGSTEERVGFERGVTLGGLSAVLATATRLAPSLAGARVLDHWSSFRPGTMDDLPLVGPTDVDGLFLATGHFRNGILLGPVTGEVIARAVTGAALDPDALGLDPRRTNRTAPRGGGTAG